MHDQANGTRQPGDHRTAYDRTDLRAGVAAAVRAPSMHNTQPWRFRLRDGAIELLLDPDRLLPVGDPTGWAARTGCGAALANLRLALAVAGRPGEVRLRPYPGDPLVLARVLPGPPRPPTTTELALYAAIPRRHSNRAPFWPVPVSARQRGLLVEAARAADARLELLVGALPVGALAEIAHSANRVLTGTPGYPAEVAAWTRHAEAADGVPVGSGGPSTEPQDLLPGRPFGTRTRAPGRDFEPEPVVAVLGSARDTAADQLAVGQALQRVLLTATDAGLAVSMLSQPIEVPAAREQLRLALGGRIGVPQMVLRVGYGQPGWPTPRLAPDLVIDPV